MHTCGGSLKHKLTCLLVLVRARATKRDASMWRLNDNTAGPAIARALDLETLVVRAAVVQVIFMYTTRTG